MVALETNNEDAVWFQLPFAAQSNKCFKVEIHASSGATSKTWSEAVQHCRAGPGFLPDLASVANSDEQGQRCCTVLLGCHILANTKKRVSPRTLRVIWYRTRKRLILTGPDQGAAQPPTQTQNQTKG